MASTLLEEILTDDEFNALSFQTFCTLSEKRKHKKIADSFSEQFNKASIVHRSPGIREKIKELMTGETSEIIPEVYRQTLLSLIKDIHSEEKLSLDINLLQKNYRYFLLSMLDEEEKKKKVVSTLEKILVEWNSIIQDRDLEYLKHLTKILGKRRKELAFEPVLARTNAQIVSFVVDETANEQKATSVVDPLIKYLKGGFLSSRAFLSKIFEENKVSTQILRYFFELHPDSLSLFKKNLRIKSSDIEFLKTTIESLRKIDSAASRDILNDILLFGTESIKIEALKAQQMSSEYDESRLFRMLEGGSTLIKKEALAILAKKESTRKKALERLFSIPSNFGTKNKILIEHIKIIQDIGLKEAKDYLTVFCKRKFFWNKKLREEAIKVLRKWDAGES